MTLEAFLDDTPGETRGVVVCDGRFEYLIIQREGTPASWRLGARSVGRVTEAGPAGAFVDLGADGAGFLPVAGRAAKVGEKIEVETSAEPREAKGPTLRLVGPGEGEPRLLAAGPDVAAVLADLAPGVAPATGIAALDASMEAEEEALASGAVFPAVGLDLAVQRTRALVAVDMDYAPPAGDGRRGRARANREGLAQAARLIRLKGWGGLVVIDLIGAGHDAESIKADARAAFGGDREVVFGPLSRFGLLQLSLPWRRTPVEEMLNDATGRPGLQTRAIALTRRLRRQLLANTAAPRLTAVCAPEEAAVAAALVARLGPRAGLRPDPHARPGAAKIVED